MIGLFKTEIIRRLGLWRSLEAVEIATLEWIASELVTFSPEMPSL